MPEPRQLDDFELSFLADVLSSAVDVDPETLAPFNATAQEVAEFKRVLQDQCHASLARAFAYLDLQQPPHRAVMPDGSLTPQTHTVVREMKWICRIVAEETSALNLRSGALPNPRAGVFAAILQNLCRTLFRRLLRTIPVSIEEFVDAGSFNALESLELFFELILSGQMKGRVVLEPDNLIERFLVLAVYAKAPGRAV